MAADTKKKNFIFGECKFTKEPFYMQQVKKLQEKVFVDGNVYFYLFSLSGFTEAAREYAASHDNVVLVDAKDLISDTV